MTQTTARKSIFAIIRRALGRPFRQSEVEAIDGVIDVALDASASGACANSPQDSVTAATSSPASGWKIGEKGVALIKRFEGCARRRGDGLVEAYPDPGTGAEPWTIGWGATGMDDFNGGRIARGTVWSQAQCDARLDTDLVRYAAEVEQALGTSMTTQNQFDALVSFHYNTGAIGRATLTRKHKAGDFAEAAREFDRWCHAGGRVLKGLARRRAAESALYRTGV